MKNREKGVKAMYWLKACPRCQGDLYRDKDLFGSYVSCLQCGHELNMFEELYLDDPSDRFVGEGVEAVLTHAA